MMLVIALFFSAETDQHENVRQAVVCKRRGFNSVVYGVWLANSLNTSPQQVSGINHVCLTRLLTPIRLERFNPIDFIFSNAETLLIRLPIKYTIVFPSRYTLTLMLDTSVCVRFIFWLNSERQDSAEKNSIFNIDLALSAMVVYNLRKLPLSRLGFEKKWIHWKLYVNCCEVFAMWDMAFWPEVQVCWSSITYPCQTGWFLLPLQFLLKQQLVLTAQYKKRCNQMMSQ